MSGILTTPLSRRLVFAAAAILTALGPEAHAQNVQPFNPTPTLDQILATNPGLSSTLGAQNPGVFRRMYTFGESYVDTGNVARIVGATPAQLAQNGAPYGRASNALTAQDTMEFHYGVAPNETYNYAVAGAKTPGFGLNGGGAFPNYADEIQAFLNSGATLNKQDLVFVEIGGNDQIAFATGVLGSNITTTQGAILGAQSGNYIASSVGTLISRGANTIAILNPGNLAYKPTGQPGNAAEGAFDNAQFQATEAGVAGYVKSGARIFLLNAALIDQRVETNPSAYGFVNTTQSCFLTPACATAPLSVQDKYLF
jgi:outer membrane lipase/esterase